MSADVIAVISAERTAGTSVAESIRFHFPSAQALHVHYLDRGEHWSTAAGDQAAQALKRERERQVREGLAAPDCLRAVFSILREPAARFASVLWYDRAEWLLANRHEDGSFSAEAGAWVTRRLEELVAQGLAYAAEVYAPLGVAPTPGRWRGRDGVEVFVLRFERLEADFKAATAALFGRALPLFKRNAARVGEDPAAYEGFRRAFAEPISAAAAQVPTPESNGEPRFDLAAETIAAFPEHERLRALKRTIQAMADAGETAGPRAQAWRGVLAEAPSDLQAQVRIGGLLSELGEHAAAAEALAQVAAAHPLQPKQWRLLASARRQAGDPVGELAALETLLELRPSDRRALSRITRLLGDLGRTAEAATHKTRLRALLAKDAP